MNKNSYATTPTVGYNLLMCFPAFSHPADYVLLAQSKSSKKFYIRGSGVITEYIDSVSWGGTVAAMCDSVVTSWTGSGAGYVASDDATGPWRSWAGGN
jgi:hypothetical protein